MPSFYADTTGKAQVGMDKDKLMVALARFCAARNITTDAELDAAINNLTDAQLLTALRALLKAIFAIKQ